MAGKCENEGLCYSFDIIENEACIFNIENPKGISIVNIPAKLQYNGQIYPVTKIRGKEHLYEEKVMVTDRRCKDYGSYRTTGWKSTNISLFSRFDAPKVIKVILPKSLKEIGEYTFRNCNNIEEVTIPSSVTSIGRYAFSGCSSLTSITIPNSVTSIGFNAFYECSSLTSVTIPSSVKCIAWSAFSSCYNLSSVTIPSSVTEIDNCAFCDCSSLTSIVIPNSVTKIETAAFRGCRFLKSIVIPSSVTEIGYEAFYYIPNLKVTICNEKGCINIGKDAFSDTAEINYIGKNGVAHVEKTTEHNSQTKTAKIKENSKKEGTHAEKKQGFFKRLFGKILNN